MNTLVKVTALEDTYETVRLFDIVRGENDTPIGKPIERTLMLDTSLVWCVEKAKKKWTTRRLKVHKVKDKPPFWCFWCNPRTVEKYTYAYTDHSLDCYLIKLKDLPSMYILEDLWGLSDGAS